MIVSKLLTYVKGIIAIITKPVSIEGWSVQQIYDYLIETPADPAYGFKLDKYLRGI